MSLTNPNVIVDTSFSSKNIASAATVYTYTASGNGIIYINVKLTNAAGNGDYVIYLKKQWGGTGTASTMLPKLTATAASGETVIEFTSIPVFVKSADVVDVYIDGLAGDTSVNGNIQIVANNFSLFDASTDNPTSNLTATAVDNIWDEVLTGATHNVNSSAGKRLRQLASQVVWDGVAQGAGINGNQIILDTGASSLDGAYDPSLIAIVAGTGAGQCRLILQYEGSTRIATVDRDWKVNPDNTSEFIIYANPGREHVNEGLAQAGTLNTITLNTSASSDDNNYAGQLVFVRSGTGQDQVRLVSTYNGTTKVAQVSENWDVIPDTTSAYVMLPTHVHELTAISTSVWANATRSLTTFGTLIADIWAYATRTLTAGGGGATAQEIWEYATRTLTSGGGATAMEIWEYPTRTLTSWREIIDDFWKAIPNWFNEKVSSLADEDVSLYRGITNEISFVGNSNISGSSDIVFTVKDRKTDPDTKAIIQISMTTGLKVLNGTPYLISPVDGSIYIIDEASGHIKITLGYTASEQLIPIQGRFYDVKSRAGNVVKLIAQGKINILQDITNQI